MEVDKLSSEKKQADIEHALLELNRVMTELFERRSSETERILLFVRRSLRQFQLDGYYSESDILVEAFLRTYLVIQGGRNIENMGGWLRSVSFNIIREHSKQRVRNKNIVQKSKQEYLSSGATEAAPLDSPSFIDNEQIRALEIALDRLSPKEKKIIMLRVVQQLSWKRIKEALEKNNAASSSEAALRQQGVRALNKLKEYFHELPKSSEP